MELNVKSHFKKNFLSMLVASVFLTGCSTGKLIGPEKKYDKEANQENLTVHEAHAVFFLEDDKSKDEKVILVSKDDQLVGALKTETYIPATVCTGTNSFHFQRSSGDINMKSADTNSQSLTANVEVGDSLFVRVNVADDGVLSADRLSEKDALTILESADYQSYLVNRHLEDCTPPPTPVILEEIELSADALFAFDGATLVDLVAKDKLKDLLEKIKTSDLEITNIVVVGHTDRIGKKEYNQGLSEKRANTIANYLKANGIKEDIKAIGFGSSDSVTGDQCTGNVVNQALIDCLQPDRRVTVELWGDMEVVPVTDETSGTDSIESTEDLDETLAPSETVTSE